MDTFKGWHGESSFWREVYARTLSTLIAAAVVLLCGVLSGVIEVHANVFARLGATAGVAVLFLLLQQVGKKVALRSTVAAGAPRLSRLGFVGFVLYTCVLVGLATVTVVLIRGAW